MDDILVSDSNVNTLERMFEVEKKVLQNWGLQITPGKIQRGDSGSYLVYKIGLQKIKTQKAQIRIYQ